MNEQISQAEISTKKVKSPKNPKKMPDLPADIVESQIDPIKADKKDEDTLDIPISSEETQDISPGELVQHLRDDQNSAKKRFQEQEEQQSFEDSKIWYEGLKELLKDWQEKMYAGESALYVKYVRGYLKNTNNPRFTAGQLYRKIDESLASFEAGNKSSQSLQDLKNSIPEWIGISDGVLNMKNKKSGEGAMGEVFKADRLIYKKAKDIPANRENLGFENQDQKEEMARAFAEFESTISVVLGEKSPFPKQFLNKEGKQVMSEVKGRTMQSWWKENTQGGRKISESDFFEILRNSMESVAILNSPLETQYREKFLEAAEKEIAREILYSKWKKEDPRFEKISIGERDAQEESLINSILLQEREKIQLEAKKRLEGF
ncbi:MAG: hypothetical protein G01um101418_698 [Parcubacteria group bacterium Gr01-1014_18]|nr:MAG: hypothetical protein Greene041636_848 [Parcubacteria group bacterium Greene0416_36]TSC80279.1 MAG: hypothetical protein G01um101418_698 [Parcubacteria group bacterium Gr01-1014_18]TSC98258.1 MAG: hypothetical protein Greene101420_851 [Parcubacteria group bacterium Greene1014_20]TSD06999.1 MAG: hypothetical protein Greene07142_456 [Parcubacteria group bacterium Greene0714_2]